MQNVSAWKVTKLAAWFFVPWNVMIRLSESVLLTTATTTVKTSGKVNVRSEKTTVNKQSCSKNMESVILLDLVAVSRLRR